MVSILLFTLSALCFGAKFWPGAKSSRASKRRVAEPIYTYSVGDDEPLPTWKRKAAPMARSGQRVG